MLKITAYVGALKEFYITGLGRPEKTISSKPASFVFLLSISQSTSLSCDLTKESLKTFTLPDRMVPYENRSDGETLVLRVSKIVLNRTDFQSTWLPHCR